MTEVVLRRTGARHRLMVTVTVCGYTVLLTQLGQLSAGNGGHA